MSEITMEQKLQLIRQIRSRYHEDQCDLSDRERLLYGRSGQLPVEPAEYPHPYEDMRYADSYRGAAPLSGNSPFSFLRLRFLLAALLLAAVILMDRNGMNIAGITPDKIYEMISVDYEDKIQTWIETMSGK